MQISSPKETIKRAPHESALLHVRGEAVYTDDIPELEFTLHAAPVLSSVSKGKLTGLDFSECEKFSGFRGVLSAADIPGLNDCGPVIHDDPILPQDQISFLGQPLAFVLADSHLMARKISKSVRVKYTEEEPTLDPLLAANNGQLVLPPLRQSNGDIRESLENSPLRLSGRFAVGGQDHFYLEGQISYAVPQEGDSMTIYCSTQHPTEMQHVVAHALNWPLRQVRVEVRRMGGGFGGKESQSALFAAAASIAAKKYGKPVKIRLDRDDDMMSTGKRHSFQYEYEVGFDETGLIRGVKADMVLNAGFSADLSGAVAARAICHADGAYFLPTSEFTVRCAKTNTQSNTAFRGFGGPQGAILAEEIIERIATKLGKDSLEIRRTNFYTEGRSTTPYGQEVLGNRIIDLVDDLAKAAGYDQKKADCAKFNAESLLIKRGLALTPVKFGISFNVKHFNQAGALVHVYTDGSVIVNHGGTEMGQGLNTKVMEIVAQVFGIDPSNIKATATDTSKIPNTSATAASTGSDLNGKAAEDAANRIKGRLIEFFSKTYNVPVEKIQFSSGMVHGGDISVSFSELCDGAYQARVQLWSEGFYKTPGLSWDKDSMKGSPFYYYAFGAALSVVEIDTCTGEWRLLSADILHDVGNSLHPEIDIGQIEGAFIQGMGWLTLEELSWDKSGRLQTHAPSTYKIPAVSDCPPHLKVKLYDKENHAETVLRSKAVGEPPLLLGFSVFYALRDAIASTAGYQKHPDLEAPATPERILNALDSVGFNPWDTKNN